MWEKILVSPEESDTEMSLSFAPKLTERKKSVRFFIETDVMYA